MTLRRGLTLISSWLTLVGMCGSVRVAAFVLAKRHIPDTSLARSRFGSTARVLVTGSEARRRVPE